MSSRGIDKSTRCWINGRELRPSNVRPMLKSSGIVAIPQEIMPSNSGRTSYSANINGRASDCNVLANDNINSMKCKSKRVSQ